MTAITNTLYVSRHTVRSAHDRCHVRRGFRDESTHTRALRAILRVSMRKTERAARQLALVSVAWIGCSPGGGSHRGGLGSGGVGAGASGASASASVTGESAAGVSAGFGGGMSGSVGARGQTVGGGGGAAGGSASGNPGNEGGPADANHCTSGAQDADETGVDCGGASCPSCNTDYKINPPNACQNQFYYANCTSGDATTVCGGVCQPRNACESTQTKDGTVGFACSRYMMWSSPMLEAAKDDALASGWSTPDNPPFVYAVAGHDTNIGGVDKAMIGSQPCCECYQLVFDQPYNEYDKHTPAPKPLVVQVFNIGATTDSFDIYMGAGGLGAFNACYGTSPPGSYLYEGYPMDGQPNGGGVKFLEYTECQDASAYGEATQASVTSIACQSTIRGACDEVNAGRSPALTNATRSSCIAGNQFDTLYHQNWSIYARRVACPDNLTRVTGCKLAPEAGLPAVDSTVTTATQAASAGFLSGYHTTTMQDCCKPACAWTEKVGGSEAHKHSLAPWTSIYTCDASDQPLTEP